MTNLAKLAILVCLGALAAPAVGRPQTPAQAPVARAPQGLPGEVLAKLKTSNATPGFGDTLESNASFGHSVAALGDLDGDGVGDYAVGVPNDKNVAGSLGDTRGGLWILFMRENQSVSKGIKLLAPDNDPTGYFGISVANLGDLDGDGVVDLAVGSRGSNNGVVTPGKVWILFLQQDGGIKAFQDLPSTVPHYGRSVANVGDLDGDGIVDLAVGSPLEGSGGVVHLLHLDTDGTARGRTVIGQGLGGFAGTLAPTDLFGEALANLGDLDGDGTQDLAVGARQSVLPGGVVQHGAVWILFLHPDGTVAAEQQITEGTGGFGGDLDPNDSFGAAITAVGDLDSDGTLEVAVGASHDDDGGNFAGSVWILSLQSDGTSAGEQKISNDAGNFGQLLGVSDEFGHALALAGDVDNDGRLEIAVGSPGSEDGGLNHGALWFVELRVNGSVAASLKVSDQPGSWQGTLDPHDAFGRATAPLGDLDGDGVHDLACAAEGLVGNEVWLFLNDEQGGVKQWLNPQSASSDKDDGVFKRSVCSLGDLDGDGVVDLAVGAPSDEEGAIWILFLEPDGSVKDEQKIASNTGGFFGFLTPFGQFGYSLARLGDLDGDGVTEIAVGRGGLIQGFWVLFMNADGTCKTPILNEAPFLQPGSWANRSMVGMGDLDADGIPDLAFNAHGDDGAGSKVGAAWIAFLNSDGTVKAQLKITEGAAGFDVDLPEDGWFGHAVGRVHDLDADGVDELAVSQVGPAAGTGAVWLLFLEPGGTVKAHTKIDILDGFAGLLDPSGGDSFGASVTGIGDFDGDGVGDIAVGATGDDDGGYNHGAVWRLALDGLARVGFETRDDLLTPLANGQSLSGAPEFGRVFTLSASGPHLGPATFDSDPLGPNAGGAHADLLVDSGHLLVLQDPGAPSQTAGRFDQPGPAPDGGTLVFTFEQPVRPLAIDLVDLDLDQVVGATVRLVDTEGRERVYDVPIGWTGDLVLDGSEAVGTLNLRKTDPQPGFSGTATSAQDPGFAARRVTLIELELGGRMAIDTLRFDPHP